MNNNTIIITYFVALTITIRSIKVTVTKKIIRIVIKIGIREKLHMNAMLNRW